MKKIYEKVKELGGFDAKAWRLSSSTLAALKEAPLNHLPLILHEEKAISLAREVVNFRKACIRRKEQKFEKF